MPADPPKPAGADSAPAAAPLRLVPVFTPDPERALEGRAYLGGRHIPITCPVGAAWGRIAWWLNPFGGIDLPEEGTPERAACEMALGLFLGAGLSRGNLSRVRRAINAGMIKPAEVVDAARANIALWWPAVEVSLSLPV